MTAVSPSPEPIAGGLGHSSWQRFSVDVHELIRRAAAAGLLPGVSVTDAVQQDPPSALRRLALGAPVVGDDELLGCPVEGGRMLCIRLPASQGVDRLVTALAVDRECVITRWGSESLLAMVRNVPHRAGEDRSRRAARRIAACVHRLSDDAAVGISHSVSGIAGISGAARDAVAAADLAAAGASKTVECDSSWASLAVLRVQCLVREGVVDPPPVKALREYDVARGTEFAKTLAVWLSLNQDARLAADALAIHPNTLRYRLRRASELSGIDLQDPAQRLIVQIVLAA